MKAGQLLRIAYAGKRIQPGRSRWTIDNDHGYPKDDGKFAINLYDEPHVTLAGTFWFVFIGSDNCEKLIHQEYLDVI